MPRDPLPAPGDRPRSLTTLSHHPVPLQWGLLLGLSVVFVGVLELVGLPAALLLGPMAAAILLAAFEGTVRVPRPPFLLAQGVVGCMIARALTPDMAREMVAHWPIFLGGVLWVLLASTGLGWWLAKRQVLPGTAAIWGSSPGRPPSWC